MEILEHFRYIKDQKIDLSDPNPQLATFMHHYQALPPRMISVPMASVILLSNLPLTTNPGQESVYQRLLESTLKDDVVTTLSLADLMQSIRDVWAARFGGIHPNQQPRRGTTYDKGKAPANKLQQKQQTQIQRNTTLKGKGPNPQYSQQHNAESGDQHTKKKHPFRRGGKGKNGREKSSGPWRNPSNPGGLSPYPHVKRSHNLMSRLGVTPTIQTSKEFEGITSLEEVTDGTFGAPTVKLGAYTLTDPPRAPTPEMAPLTPLVEAMVIDVPSDNEDTVSLGEKEDTFSVHTGIGPNPHYSGLFGDDESDYGEDPSELCGPIIESTPAGPSKHRWSFPEGYTGVPGMSTNSSSRRWADDDEAYDGPTNNELVPFCSHKGALLTDPSTASISLSIGRSLDKYLHANTNIFCGHVLHCADCKGPSKLDFIEWIVDSGASVHFMDQKEDFSDLQFFDQKNRPQAQTANGAAAIHGHGTVFVKTWVDNTPNKESVTISRLHLVFYMPGMGIRLLSMGQLLKGNMQIKGDEHILRFIDTQSGTVKIVAVTRVFTDTIYWVNSVVLTGSELTAHKSVHRDDYDLWHRRLGHPGKQAFEKFESSTRNFLPSIEIPKNPPVCEGCAKGKMHSHSFPENSARNTRLFQWIHSDLKEFAVQSYHHYKHYISFIDDNSSHSWIALLKKKSDAKVATKHFLAMVKNQYNGIVSEWMSDNRGEYLNQNYVKLLKDEGIEIQRSVPSMPQMNGRAECFNCTIDEKVESMRHQACLPDNWWEFSVLHANYLYNRSPVKRLDWQTPKGYLEKVKPDISHLRILGCGAYVFIHKDL
jgi:hypothetical protein